MQAGHARRPGRDPRRDTWSAPHRQAAATRRPRRIRFWSTHPTPTRDGGDADPTTRPNHMHQLTTCTTACAAAGRAELTPGPDPGSGRSGRPGRGSPASQRPPASPTTLSPPASTLHCIMWLFAGHQPLLTCRCCGCPKVRCRSLSGRCGSRPQCCFPIRAVFASAGNVSAAALALPLHALPPACA